MSLQNQSHDQAHGIVPLSLARFLCSITLLALAILPAQAQTLEINGSTSSSVTACTSTTLNFSGTYGVAYYGSWTYTWTLYKNGSQSYQNSQTIDCVNNGFPCQLPSFSYTVAASGMNGSYSVQLQAMQFPNVQGPWTSNTISVALGTGCATPRLKINGIGSTCPINGKSTWPVDVCAVGPITLDGSGNSCTATSGHYFASIQLSDLYWNRYGYEAMAWLSASDYSSYGGIGGFNLKHFAEDRWVHFVGGQYYRVKLATDYPWRETSTLIHILPSAAAFTLNGNVGLGPIAVPHNGPLLINGTSSTCADGYFVSVQLSDQNWNRYGPEVMGWLTASDFVQYGGIGAFDVKGYATSKGLQFVQGEYYRVKLAVGTPWSEASKLIQITP